MILFKRHHVGPIKNGTKTETRRAWSKMRVLAQREGGHNLAEYKEEFEKINGFWDDDFIAAVVRFHVQDQKSKDLYSY